MTTDTLRITQAADLVSVVPYLIGFHPTESVVAMVLRGRRLAVTARLDLPPPEEAGEVAALVHRLIDSQNGDALLLLGFSDRPDYPVEHVLSRVVDDLPEATIADVLVVRDGAWRSICDASSGRVDQSSPAVASAVLHGLRALPGRGDLGELATPGDEALASACEAALMALLADDPDDEAVADRMDELLEASPAGGLSPERASELAVLAGTTAGQQAVLRRLSRVAAAELLELWTAVVRAVPESWAAGPLALLGMAAWLNGDGALQLVCAEKALAIDENEPLARELLALNAALVPPTAWDAQAWPWPGVDPGPATCRAGVRRRKR